MVVLADNHIALSSAEDVKSICSPLFQSTNISYFEFYRLFSDGSRAWLGTEGKWSKEVLEKDVANTTDFSKTLPSLKQRYYFWNSLPELLPKVAQQFCYEKILLSKNNFNIDYGFTIVEFYENHQDYFSFAASSQYHQMVNFYVNNIEFLEKFIFLFKEKAKNLITQTSKQPILLPRIFIPDEASDNFLVSPHAKAASNLKVRKYLVYYKGVEYYFTKREVDCIYHLARGKTIKEIAKTLNLSHRTVESYLQSARFRLNFITNRALITFYWDSNLASI